MKKLIVTTFLLALSTSALAVVDLRNGNYSEHFTDINRIGSGFDLKIKRTYNSRTNFNGLFGHGWCTEAETRVELMPNDTIKLTECGAGETLIYTPMEPVDSTNKGGARRYVAQNQAYKNIVFADGQFVRNIRGTGREVFDSSGHLIRLEDINGNFIQYDYEAGRLSKMSRNDGASFVFQYGDNGKVSSISGSHIQSTRYRYDGEELIEATNAANEVTTYHYDDNKHRMDRVTWPDKRFVSLTYHANHDWVSAFTDRDGCIENYEYSSDPADPQQHIWGTVRKVCQDAESAIGKSEYWYSPKSDGSKELKQIHSEWNGMDRDVQYDERFHMPKMILNNGNKMYFDYYPNGLVKSRKSGQGTMTYAYAEDKLQRVEMVVKDNHGKVLLHTWSKFGYDAQGNMTFAMNSEGSKVKLSYNSSGQISVLRDDRIHEVSVRYERHCGKPSIITLKGIGAIQVLYKDDCEIDKVDSKHTPAVSMQVSSMFNNLLEVSAPASQDVYEAADSVFSSTEGRAVECQNCQISEVSPVER
jgi:YD repeat-containing protein